MGDWKECWDEGVTPWHVKNVAKSLQKGLNSLVSDGDLVGKSIFVPLCGKSLDLKWFYNKGLNVIGVELVEKAIIDFFNENEIPFNVENHDGYDVYLSNDKRLRLFRSDLFTLNDTHYGVKFDFIWDRGSLGAMDKVNHQKYADLITGLMKKDSLGLLEVFEYDQSLRDGSPFSFFQEDLAKLYKDHFEIEEILRFSSEEADVTIGLNESTVLYKMSPVA